jgi:hypothetical protein
MKHVPPDHLNGASPVVVTMTGPAPADLCKIALPREMTVAEAIAECDLKFRLPTIAVMSGMDPEPLPILRGQWHVRVVRAGETLSFIAVPGSGGLGGSGKQIVGIVAAVAIAVAAPYVGGALAGVLFAGNAIAGTMISAAFACGGPVQLDVRFA